MRIKITFLLTLLVIGSLSGCAGTHEFGPYSGRVVDKETNEPIEGAVVFIQFFTKEGHFAGATSYYADAVEVLTDNNGEFAIPVQRLRDTKIGRWWDNEGSVIVFKPGYGCYPWHKNTNVDPLTFPDKTYVIVKLPKLATKDERKENLRSIFYSNIDIPYEKQQYILVLINKENELLGLKPIHPANKPERN